MKKLKSIIRQFLINIIHEELKPLDEKITYANEYIRKLPIAICWYCGEGIGRDTSRVNYMGKNFHSEAMPCFKNYLRIIEHPDESYKYIKGEPVKTYK